MHIGRARKNEILLSAPDVSRRHALVEQTEDGWLVADLTSQGGTFIAGKRLEPFEKTVWKHTDTVQIGPYFLHWRPAGASEQFLVNETTEEQQTELFPVAEDGGQVQSSSGNFRVALSPATLALTPGKQGVVQLELFNQGTALADFSFTVVGLPVDYYDIPRDINGVAPGARATLPLKIQLPAISQTPSHHLAAGTHTVELIIKSTMDKTETATITLQLMVHPVEQFAMGIWPTELVSGKQCRVMIRNEGNVVGNYGLVGRDPSGLLQFNGQRGRIRLLPGEATNEILTVQYPDLPLLGRRKQLPFTIEVQTATGLVENKSGQLELRPRIPSWTLPLLELILVVGLILVVLNNLLGGGAANAAPQPGDGGQQDGAALSTLDDDGASGAEADSNPILSDTDRDGDLLNDADEARLGTDPEVVDSDGDGVPDGLEVQLHRTDPRRVDSDADGLTDGAELSEYRTDPNLRDTDLDGLTDGEEVAQGTDPLRFNPSSRVDEGEEEAKPTAAPTTAPTAPPTTAPTAPPTTAPTAPPTTAPTRHRRHRQPRRPRLIPTPRRWRRKLRHRRPVHHRRPVGRRRPRQRLCRMPGLGCHCPFWRRKVVGFQLMARSTWTSCREQETWMTIGWCADSWYLICGDCQPVHGSLRRY